MKASVDQKSCGSLALVFYVMEEIYLHSFGFFSGVFIKTNLHFIPGIKISKVLNAITNEFIRICLRRLTSHTHF